VKRILEEVRKLDIELNAASRKHSAARAAL